MNCDDKYSVTIFSTKMVSGQRCLFYYKTNNGNELTFRANFDLIYCDTVYLNNTDCSACSELHNCKILATQLDKITKIQTLPDILQKNIIIPPDILLEIDSFL